MKIYYLLFRFSFSSLFASIVDLAVFAFSFKFIFIGNVLYSIALGRLISSVVNYNVNKKLVFRNNNRIVSTTIKYYILTIAIMLIANFSIKAMVDILGFNVIAAKVVTETILFISSFSIQRDIVFGENLDE